MAAGALGFSTSRTIQHRSIDGNPTPTLRATEAELLGIAMGLKDAGRGVMQYVSDWDTPDRATEFGMLRRLGIDLASMQDAAAHDRTLAADGAHPDSLLVLRASALP